MQVLQVEMETLDRMRPELVRAHHGEYVVIQGTTLHGVFPTESQALTAAYGLLGDREPFLVHRVVREEEEVPILLGAVSLPE